MGREEELQKQLEACKKAKTILLDKLDGIMRLPANDKQKLHDAVAPVVKSHLEGKILHNRWNYQEFCTLVFEKTLKALCGEDVMENLDKV